MNIPDTIKMGASISDYHLVKMDESACLSPYASICGDVSIGAETSVFAGTQIRGDCEPIVVGERTNIQENSCLHVSVGIRLLVEMALARAEQGATARQIVDELEASKGKIRFLALLDTLEYLRRGGRISNVSAALGTLLAIKPVVTCTDGKIVVMDKPRGLKSGRSIIANLIREDGGFDFDRPLCIGYTGNSDKPARQFLDSCPDLWEGKGEVPISSIGATIGTHAGPGGFLLAYFGKNA